MKNIPPLPFIIIGVFFLLISIICYSSIAQLLLNLESQTDLNALSWDLSWVLKVVRIIFIIVGIFLTGFGIGLFWKRKKGS